jgi:tetratricopeptide (TPR) repeat protein
MSRNLEWRTPVTLMGSDITHLENSAQANNMYAMGLMDDSMRNPDLTEETRNEYRNKAIQHLKKAIAIYPNFFNYNFDLGRCYISLNDNYNAKKAYLKAYKILPKSPLVLEELTKTSFDLGQKEDTEFYGNKYLEINPNNENVNELVAYICLLHKDYAKTNYYAKRGLKYFPNNPNLNKMVIDSNKYL